jgi:hypothetical protein
VLKKTCDFSILNPVVDMPEGIPELRIRCDEQDHLSRRVRALRKDRVFRGVEGQTRHTNHTVLLGIALQYTSALTLGANPMPLDRERRESRILYDLVQSIKVNVFMDSREFVGTGLDDLNIQEFCDG